MAASTVWPHFEQVGAGAVPGAAFAPVAPVAYTRVAGGPPAAGTGIAMAEADSGLPQSMQKREPGSLLRPQCAHVITVVAASGGENWREASANIGVGSGGGQLS